MIHVEGLRVADASDRPILDDVTLSVPEGSALGVVGESGSGKTTLSLCMLGHVRPGLHLVSGRVRTGGADLLSARTGRRQELRRRHLAYLGQEPGRALTPTMRVQALVAERLASRDPAAVVRALEAVGLPGDPVFRRRFPHQLSGGQQQRLALARALASQPSVLILDEPTTGLDVVTQHMVLTEIARQRSERGLTLVVVSHDLAVVARLAETVAVLHDGRLVEQGETVQVLSRPCHRRTRALVETFPDPAWRRPEPYAALGTALPALSAGGLRAVHRGRHGGGVVAVDDVTINLHSGSCTALVGGSGSGKTTIARVLVGLHRPEAGTVLLGDAVLQPAARHRSVAHRAAVQLVTQDPTASLNPRHRVGAAVTRPLRRLRGLTRAGADSELRALFERVRLDPALVDRYPGQLSGGQRQRVAIARALAAGPRVLICDEVTSALDVSVQADVLDLLGRLRDQLGLALLFITHDLGVVARIADRALVLDRGRLCEQGTLADVLDAPRSAVTRALLAASPSLSDELERRGPRG